MPFAVVFNPALDMLPGGIMMRPVYETTSVIPLVFAKKRDRVAKSQKFNTWRQIDVVGDKQRLAGFKFKDESLMPAAVIVIRQDSSHGTSPLNLVSSSPFADRSDEFSVRRLGYRRMLGNERRLFYSVIGSD